MNLTRTRTASVVAAAVASTVLLSACGKTAEPTPTGPPKDPVTITIAYWDPGLEDLAAQYEKEHPYAKIVIKGGDYTQQHSDLKQALIAGTGAPNIATIDESYMPEFMDMSGDFVNLADMGASKYKDNYLPWKWAEGTTPDDATIVGLGSDAGGLALCYRSDLFAAAGLPTDRDAVAAAIGDTWEGFVQLGKQYYAQTGKSFIDNATNMMEPIRTQLGVDYYNRNGELEMAPTKPAFDTAAEAITSHLSAGIDTWIPKWDEGLSTDAFATVLCPSWMLPYIENKASNPGSEAKWDVTDLPGPGGNWGGAFFTIPDQFDTYTTQETYNFLEWLIQGPQQLALYQVVGKLPSQEALFADDGIQSDTNPYFNDAPVGPLFAKSVAEMQTPIYYSSKHIDIAAIVERVLQDIQSGTVAADNGWDRVIGAADVYNAQ